VMRRSMIIKTVWVALLSPYRLLFPGRNFYGFCTASYGTYCGRLV